MSAAYPAAQDPHHLGHGKPEDESRGHGGGGPAPVRVVVGYGFWIFLLSDFVMFSSFFASFAVLANATAAGPSGRQLFSLDSVAWETGCLLASSFACGLASLAAGARSRPWYFVAMAATFAPGAAFLILEGHEFAQLLASGDGPQRSAFLSAFFALVGCHGVHVTLGLMWLLTMMAQVFAKGFRADILRRILCFTLFWHALDIVWVGIFTVVYLTGVAR
ncbi:MAG TPA: cytochrome (ubi)quinol oxidase subunit III [Caulobacteraceae bacterium]|nr:cytochrome (ubi)quinol oxidase subunit III [Caulobacteraceae bacterium]